MPRLFTVLFVKPAATLFLAAAFVFTSLASFAPTASAEVRFGKNVRIGGHDVSNQTFNRKKRGRYYIYNGKPKRPGCRWKKNADGSRTKICHLQRRKR